METKFTKGEWELDGDIIFSENDEVICDIVPIGITKTVFRRSEGEAISNARLIAAAPALFEALNDLITANELSSAKPAICCWDDLIQKAKLVIKKATE